MATIPKILTYEEWLQMPTVEDGREEVVRGEIHFMPPTRLPHAEIIQRFISRLTAQVDEKDVCILGSNFGLIISRDPLTCRSPDVALFWRKDMVIQDGLCHSAPDLVVEVLSPSENRRRKEEKMADYASIGVPEAWLFSPQAETVEVRLLKDGKLQRVAILAEGTLQPTRFPGVSVNIESLWP
jgi:Uma2 family endonuclease